MTPKTTPYNIDDDFAAAMRMIGGKRPAEIDPKCLQRENADVVIPDHNMIIEVKTLIMSQKDEAALSKRINKLYETWIESGKPVPLVFGTSQISSKDLPEECVHELAQAISAPLRNAVKSANNQIKATKKSLRMESASGTLVLCNSNNTHLHPDVLLYSLHHILKLKYSSIDYIIYMTQGLYALNSTPDFPSDVYIPLTRDGRDAMEPELSKKIRRAWAYQCLTRGHVYETASVDIEFLREVRYRPHH